MWNNVELMGCVKILLSKVMQYNRAVVQAKMIVSFHYCITYFVQRVSKHKQKYQENSMNQEQTPQLTQSNFS